MRIKTVLAFSVAASASAMADVIPQRRPVQTTNAVQQISCAGPFTKAATHASLVKHFGSKNVAWETVDGPEGSTYQVTAIYPKDPKKRLEVVWRDESGRKEPLGIDVKSETTAWAGPGGVSMKMPIAEVERRNGKPFRLAGFQWDMWGWVLDWKGGHMLREAREVGCDTYTVRFEETGDSSKAAGEGPYASNSKGMKRAKPVVAAFGVGFAYPETAQ